MTTSESPRLSALQLLMREWAALAPYNGIHAMRLSAPADVDRWQKAVTAAMQTVRTLPANIAIDRPSTDLDTHVDAELHRPFSAVAGPIRFFVVEEKSGGHWFGTVFDHWLADDFSCRALLQRIYSIYRGEAGDGNSSPLEWMPPPRRRRARWREWRDFFKQAAMLRRACRTSLRDPLDFRVRTFNVALPGGTLEATQKLAKDLGATLHDVFLAATAQVFGARQKWEDGARRDSVAIASAIDLRRFEPEPARSGFGLVINQYIVMERRPHEISFEQLTKRVAAQTRQMKEAGETHSVAPTLLLWRLSRSPRARATFFQRGAPLVAGLSNVNLTGSWIEQSEITEYRRIGPTGPIVPMVLVLTTLRGQMSMDVTFRTAAFSPAEARRLVDDIIDRLPGITA